ncbi:MAG: translocation/assembly module TamB domain-containing protein [Bacteroidota bacterium]
MTASWAKRLLRISKRVFLSVFLLTLLLIIAVHLPFVQRWLGKQAGNILSDTLQTEVTVGRVVVQLPTVLGLREVAVLDPTKDTLASLEHLQVGVQLFSLLQSRVVIHSVEISDLYGNFIQTDSSSNFQFLAEAFVTSPDSSQVSNQNSSWVIELENSSLLLNDIDLYYQDDPAGLLLDLELDQAIFLSDSILLERQVYALQNAQINGLRFDFRQFNRTVSEASSSAGSALTFSLQQLLLEDINGQLDLDTMRVDLDLGICTSAGVQLALSQSMNVQVEELDLRKSKIKYDQTSAPPVVGLDPNHLALADLAIRFSALSLQSDSLQLQLERLSLRESSGLEIRKMETGLLVHPDYIVVTELALTTAASRLRMPKFWLNVPSISDLNRLQLELDASGQLATSDILLAQPQLAASKLLSGSTSATFDFATQGRATDGNVFVDYLSLRGPGIQVVGEGRADHLAALNQLNGDFSLSELKVRPQALRTILPAGSLPDYINWPTEIRAEGQVSYYDQELKLNFGAREQRLLMEQWSGFDVSGTIKQPLAFPESTVDLQLDSLQLTERSIWSYLPPALLPEGYSLPEYLWLEGSLDGPIADLLVDLRLQLPGDSTYMDIDGRIQSVMDPQNSELDVRLSQLQLRAADLLPLLPDSLLPDYFVLPDLRIKAARLTGSLDHLDFEIPVTTSFGTMAFSGRYNPEDLAVLVVAQELQAPALFKGPLRDTLLGLKLEPIGLRVQIEGSLQPVQNLVIAATIEERGRGEILQADGVIQDTIYRADLAFDHPSFQGGGAVGYQAPDSSTSTLTLLEADLAIDKIDLARWGLSDRPLLASGTMNARVNGLRPDNLRASVQLDEVLLRSSGATSYVDSFLLEAEFIDGNNQLQLRSDVMRADLSGIFQPISIIGELQQFLIAYWATEQVQPEPLQSGQYLDLTLEVFNPRPLISGIIPGLTELSPLTASFQYRDREPGLRFDLALQKVAYQNLRLEDMVVLTTADVNQLLVEANWGNIAFSEQFQLGKTELEAEAVEDALGVELKVLTAEDSLRHRLAFNIGQDNEGINLRLSPEQLINFTSWQLPENNQISLGEERVEVEDWRLFREDRSLVLTETDENGLQLDFNRFKLQTISRIINSEEELLAGQLNGTLYLDELLTNPSIRAAVEVDGFGLLGSQFGQLRAEVYSQQNKSWLLDIGLDGAHNQLQLSGTYFEGGDMDLLLAVDRLRLKNMEPFSLGYLQQTQGFIEGRLAIGGRINAPKLAGEIAFKDAALAISLLGSRFRLEDQKVRFTDRDVRFDDFTLLDSLGGQAVTNGSVRLRSLEQIELDLNLQARDFLAVNSTVEQNDLFYGFLKVDADVAIGGTATAPNIEIDASPQGDSRLTYAYLAPGGGGVSRSEGVVTFAETFEWEEILSQEVKDTVTVATTGMYLETNLAINENLLVEVIIDPVTRQEFSGRGAGNITFIQYPNGRQELTGQIEMQSGTYDMVLEGLRPYEFGLRTGSTVSFSGNPQNPQLDLTIFNAVQTSALPLVQAFNPTAEQSSLNRRETFETILELSGDLNSMEITADVVYPENQYGNRGLTTIEDALDALRQDQSRMYTTAITLITFGAFNIPLIESSQGGNNRLVNNVADAVAGELSSFLNNQLGFVDLQLGVENYETTDGQDNYNLSLSLSKSFLDDRLIISVDGVANTAEDATTGESQTYLDNISAEYLLDPAGQLRIKLFNDRDRNVLVGGNVLRFGGRLVFSKDFNRFFWEPKQR